MKKYILVIIIAFVSTSAFADLRCSGYHQEPSNSVTYILPDELLLTKTKYPCDSEDGCPGLSAAEFFNRPKIITKITAVYLDGQKDVRDAVCEANEMVIFCRFKQLNSTIDSYPMDGEIRVILSRPDLTTSIKGAMPGYASIYDSTMHLTCTK